MDDLEKLFQALANQAVDALQKAGVELADKTRLPFDDAAVALVNRWIDVHQAEYVAAISAKLRELLEKFFSGQATIGEVKVSLGVAP